MKRLFCVLPVLLSVLLLAGCFAPAVQPVITEPVEPIATTQPVTEVPTEPPTETQPEHSPLYIPGLSTEDVVRYFNEVCLDAEWENSGDASLLQKWVIPIRCKVIGPYTEEDMQMLTSFFAFLNSIEGFPGISLALEGDDGNMQLHFCTQQELLCIMGSQFTDVDGAVTFWYDFNEINRAIICYRTDLDQQVRNSVILEEIYNGLGPIQDTDLRTDSIIYSGFSQPQALTQVDELLLKLLYHPSMRCGMNATQCEEIIRQLYY